MKRYVIFTGLLVLYLATFAQSPYKLVIIPTHFSDFGEDFNPYGLSSAVQMELNKHSIESTFPSAEMPDNYCDALTVNLVKLSSMLKNKLRLELKDCRDRIVWSKEGTGRSKDFREGYAEAIAEALEGLEQLPVNQNPVSQSVVIASSVPVKPQNNVAVQQTVEKQPVPETGDEIYRPSAPYYNYTYFVDIKDSGSNKKELLIINSEPLGYTNLQKIATLTPTGIEGVYTVEWAEPGGESIRGVANFGPGGLKISLPEGETTKIIALQKL
jgi:hypothetical protein